MSENVKDDNIKARSFRVTDEDTNAFKLFAKEHGYTNQADAFNSLMQMAQLNKAKQVLGNRGKEIEVFRDTITKLITMYTSSLDINRLAEETIREELSKDLKTKEDLLKNLQEQLKSTKEENKINKEEIDSLKKQVSDKHSNVEILMNNNKVMHQQISDMKEYKDKYNTLETQLEELKREKEHSIKASHDKQEEYLKQIYEFKTKNDMLQSKINSSDEMLNFYKEKVESTREEYQAIIGKYIESTGKKTATTTRKTKNTKNTKDTKNP